MQGMTLPHPRLHRAFIPSSFISSFDMCEKAYTLPTTPVYFFPPTIVMAHTTAPAPGHHRLCHPNIASFQFSTKIAVDPIGHRPPGRLAHRPYAPPLDTTHDGNSQLFHAETASSPGIPSSVVSPAVHDGHFYYPPHQPQFPHDQLSSLTTPTPSSLVPEALFHDPGDSGLRGTGNYLEAYHPDGRPYVISPRECYHCSRAIRTSYFLQPPSRLLLQTLRHRRGRHVINNEVYRTVPASHQSFGAYMSRPRQEAPRGETRCIQLTIPSDHTSMMGGQAMAFLPRLYSHLPSPLILAVGHSTSALKLGMNTSPVRRARLHLASILILTIRPSTPALTLGRNISAFR